MNQLEPSFQADIATINSIDAVPSILQVVCHSTGRGFAAVARGTESRWIAYSVLGKFDFGLKPGGELKVKTTICHAIGQTGEAVMIDHVVEDEVYSGHLTPGMYGFQSYISMPIIRRDGTMFATLCAIDPKPHRLKVPGVVNMFKLFAELIATHIDSTDRLASSEATLLDERQTAELRQQDTIFGIRSPRYRDQMRQDHPRALGLGVPKPAPSASCPASFLHFRGGLEAGMRRAIARAAADRSARGGPALGGAEMKRQRRSARKRNRQRIATHARRKKR
jgi:GAF domain